MENYTSGKIAILIHKIRKIDKETKICGGMARQSWCEIARMRGIRANVIWRLEFGSQ